MCETVNYQSTPKCCRNCKKHHIRWGYFCRTNHFQQHGCSFSSRGSAIWRGRIRQKFRVCMISVKRPLRPQGHRLPLLKLYAISALSWVFLHIPFALKVFFFWVKYIFISLVVKFGQFCFWVLRARWILMRVWFLFELQLKNFIFCILGFNAIPWLLMYVIVQDTWIS